MPEIDPQNKWLQAIFLKSHTSLIAKGLRHSKLTNKQIAEKVQHITGKTYKTNRVGFEEMTADLKTFIQQCEKGENNVVHKTDEK